MRRAPSRVPHHGMMNTLGRTPVLIACLCAWPFVTLPKAADDAEVSASPQISYETVTFIDTDGHRYVNYATTRSRQDSYAVFMDKDASLNDYLFVSPNQYDYDDSRRDNNVLRFAQGSYALMSQGDYIDHEDPDNSSVTVDGDGIYTLSTWDGTRAANGHFGYWNSPHDYSYFAIAWVFPEHFRVLEYHSNRPGEWVRRGNTLAYFATDTNDLTFEIRYCAQNQETFHNLKSQLADVDAANIEQQQDIVTVILDNEILFSSGSASLSDDGTHLIEELGQQLRHDRDLEIVVEGHTDNVPISGALAELYPTNWELSAKRALNVVHALSAAGVSPYRLQAHAFGPFKPRVENDSPTNRKANRRIELIIRPRV